MLETSALPSSASSQRIDRHRSRFSIAVASRELRREGSANPILKVAVSSERFSFKKFKRVSRGRLSRKLESSSSVRDLRWRNEG